MLTSGIVGLWRPGHVRGSCIPVSQNLTFGFSASVAAFTLVFQVIVSHFASPSQSHFESLDVHIDQSGFL